MYTIINEPISVVGVYTKNTFIPRKFKWRSKEYKITRITLATDTKKGLILERQYSVLVESTVYRLLFNRTTEEWSLEEVWIES